MAEKNAITAARVKQNNKVLAGQLNNELKHTIKLNKSKFGQRFKYRLEGEAGEELIVD